jgi:hypothetical protein
MEYRIALLTKSELHALDIQRLRSELAGFDGTMLGAPTDALHAYEPPLADMGVVVASSDPSTWALALGIVAAWSNEPAEAEDAVLCIAGSWREAARGVNELAACALAAELQTQLGYRRDVQRQVLVAAGARAAHDCLRRHWRVTHADLDTDSDVDIGLAAAAPALRTRIQALAAAVSAARAEPASALAAAYVTVVRQSEKPHC